MRRTRAEATPPPDDGAYDAAVRYLANRPRSVAEIRRHLRTKRYSDTAIDRAVDQLRAQRYIDDEAFARYWVEQRERFRQKGERALVSELLGKGVPRETIDLVLGERDPDADVKQAREAIRRPITRWQTLEEGERKRKIHQFLVARGFSYDTIEAVLERPEADEDDPDEES
ncbi:MAG TPA: RecX family transcriptional regulator [Candidatus Limnocylindria bacterium]|nr:RecX family transcriptional regulator [Candidatus Limnocylindria bacterium]